MAFWDHPESLLRRILISRCQAHQESYLMKNRAVCSRRDSERPLPYVYHYVSDAKEIPPPHAAAGFFHALFYRKNLNYKIWEASASVEIWEPCLPPFPHITYFNKSIASQCILHVKLHIVYLKGVAGLSRETVKPQRSRRGCNFVAGGFNDEINFKSLFLLCHLLKMVSVPGHSSGLQGEFRSRTKPLQVLTRKPKLYWWGARFYVCDAWFRIHEN